MKTSLSNNDLVDFLRTKINPNLEEYISSDYEGIAVHTSSIIITVNQEVADMFGYDIDEFIGMNAWLLFTHESVQALMQHLVEKSEEPYEVTGVRKDKSEFKVLLKGHDFEIAGEPVRAVMLNKI